MEEKVNTDNAISTIGDAVVRESDLLILQGPNWLSDRIIGYYFEHLYRDAFEESQKVCFISPEVSQFLKLVGNQEVSCFVEPLDLASKEIITVAVNNATDPSQPGGTHWSLLVYSSQANTFYHLDSSSGMNNSDARMLSKKIYHYLKSCDKSGKVTDPLSFLEVPGILQQSNGYDCGIHLLANAKHAVKTLMIHGFTKGIAGLSEKDVNGMRNEIKQIIMKNYCP